MDVLRNRATASRGLGAAVTISRRRAVAHAWAQAMRLDGPLARSIPAFACAAICETVAVGHVHRQSKPPF